MKRRLLPLTLVAAFALLFLTPAFAAEQLDQENELSGGALFGFIYDGVQQAQTITVGTSGDLSKIDLPVFLTDDSVSEPLVVQIWHVDSTTGLPSTPYDGSVEVGSTNFEVYTDTSWNAGMVSIDVSSLGIPVTAGEQIAIVLSSGQEGLSLLTSTAYVWLGCSSPNSYAGGGAYYYMPAFGSSWISGIGDFGFCTYVDTDPSAIDVDIDVKPGSSTNPINLKAKGSVPVAILGSADFDVADVDLSTVTFAGASISTKKNGTWQASKEDVNGDGIDDLVLHFAVQDLDLDSSATEAVLDGQLTDGTAIQGSDTVQVK